MSRTCKFILYKSCYYKYLFVNLKFCFYFMYLRYQVVEKDTNQLMFRIEEESSICFRCTPLLHCPPSCRPYKMTIIDEKGAIVATSERPCKLSCLCVCRPEVIVKDNTGTTIGKVVNPCPPCV
jgi:hypothetical protein